MEKNSTVHIKGAILGNFIFLIAISLLVGGYTLKNLPVFRASVEVAGGLQPEKLPEIESLYRESVAGRNRLIDLYGASLKFFRKNMVSDFDFIKDDRGIIQLVQGEPPIDAFKESLDILQRRLERENIPLVYLVEPDVTEGVALAEQIHFLGQRPAALLDELAGKGFDILDLEDVIGYDMEAPAREKFFFHSDGHYSTYGEFWMCKCLARHLKENYNIEFPNSSEVFDLRNYEIRGYDFLGNIARSAGQYFTKTDRFENYIPTFDTEMELIDKTGTVTRHGDFESVAMNGYESNMDHDLYTYWIGNYGQYPEGYYEYRNLLNPDGPELLLLIDSTFMRGATFLALAGSRITVVDTRFSGGVPYVEQALDQERYDAVIVCGVNLFGFGFASDTQLPQLPERPAQQLDYNIGKNGICLGKCNGTETGNADTIVIDRNSPRVEIDGWAADFERQAPLSALYLQVGEKVVKCSYGIQQGGVAVHYQNDVLMNTGFYVTFPTSYLQAGVETLQFIQIGADGTYSYEPVVYQLAQPQKRLQDFRGRIQSYRWDGFQLEVEVVNTSGTIWTETDQVRLAVFSDWKDTGLRGILKEAVWPNETAVFSISFAENRQLLSTDLTALMVQEGIGFFAECERVNRT